MSRRSDKYESLGKVTSRSQSREISPSHKPLTRGIRLHLDACAMADVLPLFVWMAVSR
jgi:hypothetical protein